MMLQQFGELNDIMLSILFHIAVTLRLGSSSMMLQQFGKLNDIMLSILFHIAVTLETRLFLYDAATVW